MLLKKALYILIYFVSISSLIAQQLEAVYAISTNRILVSEKELKNQNIPKDDVSSFNKSFELINTMKSFLKASQFQSFFWYENKMPSDVNDYQYRMAKIMLGHNDKFYTNLKERTITRFFNAYDQNIKMNLPSDDLKWKLINETKVIGNIKCYKATTTYTIKNSLKEQTLEAVAWYSPEVQFNFGPAEFSGLPGLIIELVLDKLTYTIENFKITDEIFQIPKLPQAKLFTQHELDKLVHEMANKLPKNY